MLEFYSIGSANGPCARYVHDPDSRGIGTVRSPRLVPNSDDSARLGAWLSARREHGDAKPTPCHPPAVKHYRTRDSQFILADLVAGLIHSFDHSAAKSWTCKNASSAWRNSLSS